MKISFEKGYKQIFTIEEVEIAKKYIEMEKKEDELEADAYAFTAMLAVEMLNKDTAYKNEILRARATIAHNERVTDWMGEGSGDLDVLVEFVGHSFTCYYEIGAYLSDICSIIFGKNEKEIAQMMFVRRYKVVR